MSDNLPMDRTSSSGDVALDSMLSDLLELLSEIGGHLLVPDEDDPEGMVGSKAVLHLYEDDTAPLPSHSLDVTPMLTDAGNIAISATVTFMPTDEA